MTDNVALEPPAGATRGPKSRRAWRATFVLTGALLVCRVVYLVWLCPYELAADEAQYWDWSRRPALSYYSKGPGVAWTIGISTAVCGNAEWAVRLPVVVAAAVAMLALAGLATDACGGDARVGLAAAALFALVPAYQATALLMTIDGPLFACWLLAAWAALRAFRAQRVGRAAPWAWLGLGAALGVGFLYKYTILLLLPGLVVCAIVKRRRKAGAARATPGVLLATAAFLAVISPVLIWNHRHGYPTVAHLLDHLGVGGGDTVRAQSWAYDPTWTLELIGGQLGIIGPFLCILLVLTVARSVRRPADVHPNRPDTLLLLYCAAPVLLFYLIVSFVTDCEGNWPLAGYLTLLVPAAQALVAGPPDHPTAKASAAAAVRDARHLRRLWRGIVVYGLVTGLGMLMLNVLDRAPVLDKVVPLHRVSGHRAWAADVGDLVEATRQRTGRQPLIVTGHYGRAALLAYYLPGRPSVACAASLARGSRSAYDFFADTDLRAAARLGQPAVMVGHPAAFWQRALRFGTFEQIGPGRFIGLDYRGPRADGEKGPLP